MKIFQTWKSRDPSTFTHIYKHCYGTWQIVHPECEHLFLDDNDIEEYCKKYFPEYYEDFINLPSGILRADIIRYMVLYVEGGLYVDIDFMALKNHSDIITIANCSDKNIVFGKLSNGIIPNAWMMSLKKNEIFWLFVLKTSFSRCKNKNYRIEEMTGPDMLTDCITYYTKNKDKLNYDNSFQFQSDILILPSVFIYPIDWSIGWYPTKPIEYDQLVKANTASDEIMNIYPNSYAITFWNHNW